MFLFFGWLIWTFPLNFFFKLLYLQIGEFVRTSEAKAWGNSYLVSFTCWKLCCSRGPGCVCVCVCVCWNSDSLYIERYVKVFSLKPVFPMKNVPVIYLGNRCLFLDILGALQVLVGWALEGSSLHPSLLLIDLYLSELFCLVSPHLEPTWLDSSRGCPAPYKVRWQRGLFPGCAEHREKAGVWFPHFQPGTLA